MKSTRHSSAVKDKAEKLNSVMGQMRRGSIQTPSISLNHRRSSALEKEGSMISVQSPMSTQVGLRYENIVPCFISNHVKDLCEETCWENWLAANSEAKDAEEDTIDVDSLFKSKVEHSIKDMKPNAEESFAAVVMADVSGYSNLSSTLAEKGAEGAEILSKTMKGYLDKIIDIIIRHGGDIVKFAGIFKFTKGDAVIFYWKLSKDDFNSDKTDDNVRGEIVLQAAHCCLELLKLLGSYEVQIPELGSKILRIHLGIGAGSVYDVNVGGLDRWEHFIGGDAVNQLASVLDLAKAGELALSHQALKYFSVIVDIASVCIGSYDKRCIILTGLENATRNTRNLADNSPKKQVKIEMSNLIKSPSRLLPVAVQAAALEMYKLFINPAALYKMQLDINQSKVFKADAGLTDLISLRESRQITTIFIKIGSLTKWDSDQTLTMAQDAMSIVQEALRKYEGSLRQKHVDDKGATILIFFGLPPLAHENDASFGLKAGLEICEKFSNSVDDFSIGITTGIVSIGGVGNESRIEYAVMGDSINMAARLMCNQKAKESILCDEKTYSLCENEFVFNNLGTIKVKGKTAPISIYQPKFLRENFSKALTVSIENDIFVGRDKERAIIEETLKTHLITIGPRILIVEGDGGMGLSTLATWTCVRAEELNISVVTGNSAEAERASRYYIWRDIITNLLKILDTMEGPKNAQVEPRTPMFLMKKDESELDKDLYSGSSSKNQKSSVGTKSATGNNNNKERKPGALRSTADPSARTGFGKIASKPKVPTVPEKLKGPSKHMRSLIPLNEEGKPRPMISNASIDALANVVATDEKWKSFEEKIKKGLAKAGEYPTQSALMNLIFPFEFAQTEVYAKLQGKFRINELTDLLRRVINYVSDKKPITIMAYEAQFIDEHSWELIWDLCNSCPKLMFNIYSRPEQHYRNMEARHSYMKFKKHANCQFISLSGLSFDDTESLLIRSWTTHTPVKSVAKSVAQSVHQRTEGNPMHVKSMIGALKESGYFGVEGGELKIVKSGFDFEKSISLTDNLKTTVTSQLDRIGSNFQLFLKVASVLGQPFLLMDTLVLLQDTPGFNEMFEIGLDENAIADKIKHMDKYEYLTRTDNVTMGVMLQFKSSLVRNCVYSSMLVAQRQQLHLNVACYYEEIINASNQQRLFLSLYEHYTEAEESYLDKRLTYLEILAHIYFEKRSIGEAVNHYLLLIDLSQKNPTIFFDEASKSTWHRELGESYFSQGLEALAEKHLLESLKIAGSPFPSNYLWLSWKLESERRIRASFPILLAGDADLSSGVSKMPDADPKEVGSSTDSLSKFESGTNFDAKKNVITEEMRFDPMALQLEVMLQDRDLISEHNVRRALSCLAIIYLNTGKLKRHAYAVHAGTNVSEIFPRDAIYAKFMAMSGELGWITGGKKRTTLRYIESATKHDQRFDLHTTVSIVLKSALTFFFMGKWGSAIRRLGTLPALEMMSGDFSIRIDALRMRSLVVHFCGVAPQSLKAAKSLYLISNREDNWLGKLWGCELILANFINSTKTQGEVQLYANNLKNLWLDVPEKEKTDPILCLNYTALIAKAAVRMAPQTFSLDEFVKSMLKISNEINRPVPAKISENLCNTRGGESNSISGPHSWLSILGILHSLNVMLLAYDTGLINSSSQKNSLRKICNELEKFLTRGVFMKQMTISEPVALLVRGVGLQISSRGGATKAWKKALACRRVSDLMYVRGLLHLYIACYTDNPSDSNHNAHESQKIFSRIGATVDFERAKSFRKDKKGGKKSRASAASAESDAEPRELDENNMGYSMFDENQSQNSADQNE